jgi:hypothetical protein
MKNIVIFMIISEIILGSKYISNTNFDKRDIFIENVNK